MLCVENIYKNYLFLQLSPFINLLCKPFSPTTQINNQPTNHQINTIKHKIKNFNKKNPWKSWKDFSEELSGANFSSEVWIEEVGISKVRPAGISDSNYSLNSSEVRKLCNISHPASDGVEIQEARVDVQVGAQHLTFAVLAALIGFHVVTVLLLGYQLTGS
jgi:hypothetical protein